MLGLASLSETTFEKCAFTKTKFGGKERTTPTTIQDATFKKCTFEHSKLGILDLDNCAFEECTFLECTGDQVLLHALATPIDLSGSRIHHLEVYGLPELTINIEGGEFHHLLIQQVKAHAMNCTAKDLMCSECAGSSFNNAILDGARVTGELKGVTFIGASMRNASLLECILDADTRFDHANVIDLTIDRYALEYTKDYGGLTSGQRIDMDIRDGVAELRAAYSGFWQWIHLVALVLFLFPYLWFIGSQWSAAKFDLIPGDSIPLWKALLRYIVSGGEYWRSGWSFNFLSIISFLFLLAYNSLRFVLLWKTKQLELEQEAKQLPPRFTLSSGWGWESKWGKTLRYARYAFRVNVFVLIWHTFHFMTQEIPV